MTGNVVQTAAAFLGVVWGITLAWVAGMLVACHVMEWRLRRRQVRDTVAEAEAILEVTERVRESSPPLPSRFLAECVSNACESQKGMGL